MAESLVDPWKKVIEQYTPKAAEDSGGSSYSGGKVDANWVVDGLVKRGLPRHLAEGFAMNMEDESGFDPGINERNPIVEGSRGGYGLYQLTGPRRRAYERFAADRGVDFADPDAQLDFLVRELEGPENRAYRAMMETNSAGEAGAVIVNQFLRPAEEHRRTRSSRYLQAGGYSGDGSELATNEPVMQGSLPTDFSRLWLDVGES